MARRLGVSRQDVVDAAVLVCDNQGLDGLTVAAVAKEVGCRPPSVYHHVDGLDGLIRAVTLVAARDRNDTVRLAVADTTGIETLRAVAAASHAWAVANPARFTLLERATDPEDDSELATLQSEPQLIVHDALAEAGVAPERRPPLLAAIRAAVFGGIHTELAAGGDDPESASVRATGRGVLLELLLHQVEHDPERSWVAP